MRRNGSTHLPSMAGNILRVVIDCRDHHRSVFPIAKKGERTLHPALRSVSSASVLETILTPRGSGLPTHNPRAALTRRQWISAEHPSRVAQGLPATNLKSKICQRAFIIDCYSWTVGTEDFPQFASRLPEVIEAAEGIDETGVPDASYVLTAAGDHTEVKGRRGLYVISRDITEKLSRFVFHLFSSPSFYTSPRPLRSMV